MNKAVVKIEFIEQSKGVTAQARVELEGDVEAVEELRLKAQSESEKAFDWAFSKSQTYTLRK